MTRKDYIALSAILHSNRYSYQVDAVTKEVNKRLMGIASDIARYCKDENPKGFDSARFMSDVINGAPKLTIRCNACKGTGHQKGWENCDPQDRPGWGILECKGSGQKRTEKE